MATTIRKAKGRRVKGPFTINPKVYQDADYWALGPSAFKLFHALQYQYNGKNNGDLEATWERMRQHGFNSQTTLSKAIDELMRVGFLIRTREGRFMNPGKRCALYALSFYPIDECPGKDLDVRATTLPPAAEKARKKN